jgi:hypothetical protein
VVSTNGLEEELEVFSFVEKVQRRQQQEVVVQKEVSVITESFGESYSEGRHTPALCLCPRNPGRPSFVTEYMRSLVLAAALLAATSIFAADVFAADVEHAFQSVVPRGTVQRVVISIPTGSFTIRNGAATSLALSGISSRDYDTAREKVWAQKVVNDTSVEIYVNGDEAIVRRKFGKNAQSWRAQKFTGLDLKLNLPPGVDVEFDTTAGEVDMAGDFGDVNIDLRAGEIDVKVPKARVRELNASCRVGEVRADLGNNQVVTHEGVFPGKTHHFNANGTSHVNLHVTAGEIDVALTR